MLTRLLKTAALFWLAAPVSSLNPGRVALKKETTEEIDQTYIPKEIRSQLREYEIEHYMRKMDNYPLILDPINEPDLDSRPLSMILREEEAVRLAEEKYNTLRTTIHLSLLKDRLTIFNQVKSYALGLDNLFKRHDQTQVKYHQVLSAVYQTLYDLFSEKNSEALCRIFGSVINNQHALQTIRSIIIDFVEGIEAAKTDRELNNVLNNFRIVDQPGRFESRLERVSESFVFDGRLEISHSYAPKPNFEEGDTINVVLRIKNKDIAALRKILQPTFRAYNLEEGELTGKTNHSGGHVSLLLRGKYTKALEELVAELNENLTRYSIHFHTSGEIKIVTPPDIRTSCSVLSELHETTIKHLQEMQNKLYDVTQDRGNNLPPLHITQGNAKIQPADEEMLQTFYEVAPQLEQYLRNYGLDLAIILSKDQANTCFQASI